LLLSIKNLQKTYGAITVLDDITFVVNAGERIGIVGPNGVGKSTLLRLLTGQDDADTGTITYAPGIEFGYLAQTTPQFYGRTIDDLIMESLGNLRQLEQHMRRLEQRLETANATELPTLLEDYNTVSTQFQDRGGYDIDYKIESIFEGLRIAYLPRTQDVDTLSGGEKARIGMATLLLRSPDMLLLDEPTNHLDFASMEWLENYLSEYRGAVLMVSHDRRFLNRTASAIFEINEHNHHLKIYHGNYDDYVTTKATERKQWEENYERQQEEVKDLKKRIKVTGRQIGHTNRAPRDNDKFARYFFGQNVQSAVSRNIRAAEVQLERIEADPIPKPPELLNINSHFNITPLQSQMVINITGLSKSFGERHVLRNIQITAGARARIMLIGPNGAGKTTLFKLLMEQEQPDEGEVRIVESARIGYLAQEPDNLDLDKTVIDTYRYGQEGYEGEFIGKLLGYGLFRLEDMQKKVRHLSVGQRRKLEIARLMAQAPNVLLLDEPTNYISLDMLEAFEKAVLAFPGPVIAISHDRWFIERFGGEIWELSEGQLLQHENRGQSQVVRS
jgi:macrolide transport system ATP-binding/permease protein